MEKNRLEVSRYKVKAPTKSEFGDWRYEIVSFVNGERTLCGSVHSASSLRGGLLISKQGNSEAYPLTSKHIVHSDINYNSGFKLGIHKSHNGNIFLVDWVTSDELAEIADLVGLVESEASQIV